MHSSKVVSSSELGEGDCHKMFSSQIINLHVIFVLIFSDR